MRPLSPSIAHVTFPLHRATRLRAVGSALYLYNQSQANALTLGCPSQLFGDDRPRSTPTCPSRASALGYPIWPAVTKLSSRKLQLPHRRLKAWLLPQWVLEWISLEVLQARVRQPPRRLEPFRTSKDHDTPARRSHTSSDTFDGNARVA